MRVRVAAFAPFTPPVLAASRTQLALHLRKRATRDSCDSLCSELNAAIDITRLGRSMTNFVAADTRCSALSTPLGHDESAIRDVAVSADTDILYPTSTFHLDLHLSRRTLTDEIGCVSADITPEFTPMAKMILQLVQAITFLAVLFVGSLRTLVDKPDITTEQHAGPQQLSHQSALPGVSDCLYHLQFIFLTGALILLYPRFYQLVVNHLIRFPLLGSSNALTKDVTYPSVNDAIYEINGTYGGTYGLEPMTQIVGAPMTMGLRVNMVILTIFISIAIALLLEVVDLDKYVKWKKPDGVTEL
ncbi:hypothetical protein F5B21DRAFT_525874 [Xylaria acuta]|nr:hypothetical protein F5B21DRAFT_525874 [Xylaria acuta]